MTAAEALRDFVGAFARELHRCGVRHVCLCPGSRSTPLALVLREQPGLRLWVHLDERSAAFFALGMARALRQPVAVVTTSGTAAVNLAPAVAEARYGRVPLLALTADRPPEMREVGANQTIDQARLYGSHAKWTVEMPVPDGSPHLPRYARAVARRAVATARVAPAGPVHVNFPFREPLLPAEGPPAGLGMESDLPPGATVWTVPRRPEASDLRPLAETLARARRGLIVCGPQEDPDLPAEVVALATALGFPVLADPLSQVRCGPHYSRLVIDSYDAFLRDEEIADALAPDVVLRLGGTPTSRPLLHYLQRHGAALQVLVDDGGWNDPALVAQAVVWGEPRAVCQALRRALPERAGPDIEWASRWQAVARAARAALDEALSAQPVLSEPGAVRALADALPAGADLFLGNSMPVRDADAFFPGDLRPLRFLGNRGASGIDGVVSSALGGAAVSGRPTVLVLGDLSFYHDMNGLLAARRFGIALTIVLLNNDGGGIFHLLPQAEREAHFEELFGTPHGLDFRHAAALYGLAYRQPESREELACAVRESLASPTTTVLEVRTDREANARLHRELWQRAVAAARQAIGRPAVAATEGKRWRL